MAWTHDLEESIVTRRSLTLASFASLFWGTVVVSVAHVLDASILVSSLLGITVSAGIFMFGMHVDEKGAPYLANESERAALLCDDNVETASLLLQLGADPLREVELDLSGGKKRVTPLMWLCGSKRYCEVLRLVLSELKRRGVGPACLDAKDVNGNTALHNAVLGRNPEGVEQLLASGASPEIKEDDGRTAINLAVCLGNVDVVRALIHGGAAVTTVGPGGLTLLSCAYFQRQYEVAAELIHHVDINQADDGGRFPLDWAVVCQSSSSFASTIKDFIDGGCSVPQLVAALTRAVNSFCWTSDHEQKQSLLENISLLTNSGAPAITDTITNLVRRKEYDLLDTLSLSREELSRCDSFGESPLALAVSVNDVTAMAILLKAGADPNGPVSFGMRPLGWAVLRCFAKAQAMLLASGADPNARDDAGDTALLIAVRIGDDSTARSLLRAGADPNIENPHGENALDLAVIGDHEAARRAILAAGGEHSAEYLRLQAEVVPGAVPTKSIGTQQANRHLNSAAAANTAASSSFAAIQSTPQLLLSPSRVASREVSQTRGIYLSYADEDQSHLEAFLRHLASPIRHKPVTTWHRGLIAAGESCDSATAQQIGTSCVVLALVSADWLASRTCQDEFNQALRFGKTGRTRVVSILVRSCRFEDSPSLAEVELLPRNRKAVTLWNDRDDAWTQIVNAVSALPELR